MKLYIYRGLDNEKVPKDIDPHVIIENGVATIKKDAFCRCKHLVSIIMDDNVKTIEGYAFYCCHALRIIRLSNKLEYIGDHAFGSCDSLEVLFLPSTVKIIACWDWTFVNCESLRLLILPDAFNTGNGNASGDIRGGVTRVIKGSVHQTADIAGVRYELIDEYDSLRFTIEIYHMDDSPFHKLYYNSSVNTQQINDYLDEHGNDSTLQIGPIHGMTPLHMLTMDPNAPAETIAALLNSNTDNIFCLDSPLDYARDYNVGGLIGMVAGICNKRHASQK